MFTSPANGPATLIATDANQPDVEGQLDETVGVAQIAFLNESSVLTAGLNSGLITVQVTDANGTPLSNQEIDLQTSSAGGVFLSADGTMQISSADTDANGQITFLYQDVDEGSPVLTATDVNLPNAQGNLAETVSPAQLTFISEPAVLTAGLNSGVITVQLSDANGNPISGEPINLQTSDDGQFFNTDGTPLFCPLTTDGNGEASFLYEDATVGQPTLTATDNNLPDAEGQQTETVGAGQIAFLTESSTLVAGINSSPITVQATDANGLALAGQTIDLQSTDGAGQFFQADGVTPVDADNPLTTDADGQAEFVYDPGAGGPITLTATGDALTGAQDQLTEQVIGFPYQIIVNQDSPVFTAGQNSDVITLEVVDANGAVVPNQDIALSSLSNLIGDSSGQFLRCRRRIESEWRREHWRHRRRDVAIHRHRRRDFRPDFSRQLGVRG